MEVLGWFKLFCGVLKITLTLSVHPACVWCVWSTEVQMRKSYQLVSVVELKTFHQYNIAYIHISIFVCAPVCVYMQCRLGYSISMTKY